MKAQQNQSWLDLAVKEAGTVEDAFEMAMVNGAAITDAPDMTSEYKAARFSTDTVTQKYYAKNKIDPGTKGDPDLMSGIDFWAIEVDFEVV